jgi:hypothetical protein
MAAVPGPRLRDKDKACPAMPGIDATKNIALVDPDSPDGGSPLLPQLLAVQMAVHVPVQFQLP